MRGGGGQPHFTSFGQSKKAKLGYGKMRQINLVFLSPFLEEKFKSLGRLRTEIKIVEIFLILPHSGSQKGKIGMR